MVVIHPDSQLYIVYIRLIFFFFQYKNSYSIDYNKVRPSKHFQVTLEPKSAAGWQEINSFIETGIACQLSIKTDVLQNFWLIIRDTIKFLSPMLFIYQYIARN